MDSMKDFESELEESYKELDSDYIEQAEDDGNDIWVTLKEQKRSREVISVKIKESVKGGVIAYIDEQRAFIPASQLSDTYVEATDKWVGKRIDVIITEVDKEKKNLVLSAREVIKEKKKAQKQEAVSRIKAGDVLEGTVDAIQPYGAFIKINDDISGLLHISQISETRLSSPREALKEGQTVKVKVQKIENGKISFSMRGIEGEYIPETSEDDIFMNYESKPLTTSLGDLLSGIKL